MKVESVRKVACKVTIEFPHPSVPGSSGRIFDVRRETETLDKEKEVCCLWCEGWGLKQYRVVKSLPHRSTIVEVWKSSGSVTFFLRHVQKSELYRSKGKLLVLCLSLSVGKIGRPNFRVNFHCAKLLSPSMQYPTCRAVRREEVDTNGQTGFDPLSNKFPSPSRCGHFMDNNLSQIRLALGSTFDKVFRHYPKNNQCFMIVTNFFPKLPKN